MAIVNFTTMANFDGSTIIVPSISMANVPQLAVDLLIHTLKLEKVGSLDDKYLYPFSAPFDRMPEENPKLGISSAVEIYYLKELQVTAIQQRSPILPGFTEHYVNETIAPFLSQHKFRNVWILDSVDAGMSEGLPSGTMKVFSNLEMLRVSLESLNIGGGNKLPDPTNVCHSLYACKLVAKLISPGARNFELGTIVTYIYEGDNFNEAEKLSDKVAEICEWKIESWKRPVSWSGVYGDREVPTAMEEGLYG